MLVFTCFDTRLQAEILSRIVVTMADGAALIIGIHENLPEGAGWREPWYGRQRISRKTTDQRRAPGS